MKVDIVLCVPGSHVSMKWTMNLLRLYGQLAIKGLKVFIASAQGHNIYIVRNSCLRFSQSGKLSDRIDQKPFNGEIDYDHMVWIDSDNLIEPEYVERLISHDVDIVAGWYKGVLGVGEEIHDKNRIVCGVWSDVDHDYVNYIMEDFLALPRNEKGLVPVHFTGFGLICFKKGKFERLSYPWFNPKTKYYGNNAENAKIMTDDVSICERFRYAGFNIFVDPTCRILHEKEVAL